MEFADLSHPIEHGMTTYPGLPGPVITDHLSFDDSHDHYAPGTEFHIGRIDMVANTGTYLDAPGHRWRGGEDLAGIDLRRVAALPGVMVRHPGPVLDAALLDRIDVPAQGALLFDTGWDRHWGTEHYGVPEHPHLSPQLVERIVASRPALVGIDSVNVDATTTGERPAHSLLLEAGILVVEHLTGLATVPDAGFEFFAVPPRVTGLGTFPVRAFARW